MNIPIESVVEKQRAFFATHRTKDVEFRMQQLRKLKEAIIAHENLVAHMKR